MVHFRRYLPLNQPKRPFAHRLIIYYSEASPLQYDRGQVRVIFLRTELFPYLFPSDAPAARKCGGSYFIVSLNF